MLDPKFFIVMDRLYETLDVRMKSWSHIYNENKGTVFGFGAKKDILNEIMVERMIVAYDLAAALWYMHDNR
jgi:hypothetical protein